jgi:hypothetical protein
MSARESNRHSFFCQPTITLWGRGERSKNKLSVRYWEDPLGVGETGLLLIVNARMRSRVVAGLP